MLRVRLGIRGCIAAKLDAVGATLRESGAISPGDGAEPVRKSG